MKCPHCQASRLFVLETRSLDDAIWRRRLCDACAAIVPTVERAEARMPVNVWKRARGRYSFLVEERGRDLQVPAHLPGLSGTLGAVVHGAPQDSSNELKGFES